MKTAAPSNWTNAEIEVFNFFRHFCRSWGHIAFGLSLGALGFFFLDDHHLQRYSATVVFKPASVNTIGPYGYHTHPLEEPTMLLARLSDQNFYDREIVVKCDAPDSGFLKNKITEGASVMRSFASCLLCKFIFHRSQMFRGLV
jgi:hypothetical protein